MRAEHPDHAPAQLDAFVLGATEHRTDLVLTLARGASITGVVQDPLPPDLRLLVAARQATAGHDPAAARDRDIRAEVGDGLGDHQCEVAPDQTFELGGLDPAATYTVWLVELREEDLSFPVASTPIDVRAGSRGVALRHEAGASVSFVVVDASTNAPLTQLQVASTVGQGGVLDFVGIVPLPPQPHEGGRVTLDGLRAKPGDTLRCVVKAPGYQPHTIRDVTVPRAGRLDLGTIRLAPARQLRIVVVDDRTNAPVVGAEVVFENMLTASSLQVLGLPLVGSQRTVTDEAGRCTMHPERQPDGDASPVVVVRSAAHAPARVTVPQAAASEDLTVRLVAGGSLRVRAVDASGTARKALVEHRDAAGQTERRSVPLEGAAWRNLSPGEHAFRLVRERYPTPPDTPLTDADWRVVTVTQGSEHDIELPCLPVATLTGIVRQNGAPLPNAAVRLLQGDGSDAGAAWGSRLRARQNMPDSIEARRVTTDELGRYRLDDLPPGRHRLHVAHRERAMPSEFTVTLAIGDNQRDVELVATIVRGRVLDQDGRANEDAHVVVVLDDLISRRSVHSSPQNRLFHDTFATTDGLGQFVLRGLPSEQDLVAHVTKPGHAPAWARFRIAATAPERTLELRLEAGASLIVTSSDATLAANVQVTFVADGSNAGDSLEQPAGGMLQNGRLQFEDLRPGRWHVQLVTSEPATAPAPKTVELRAGATTTVTF